MTETSKQKLAANMCTTLKQVASDERFKKAVKKIKDSQHEILTNGWYDYTKLD